MARPELRGMLLSAQGTVTIVGLCIAYWLDYGLSFVNSPAQWRFPISFQAFFAIFLVLQMLPLPDTPRWLCEQDRSDEAASVLARLQLDQPADESSPEVVQLRRQIETAIEIESAGGPFKYRELLSGGKMQNLRRMILAGLVNVQQQFTGASIQQLIDGETIDRSRIQYDQLLCPDRLSECHGPLAKPLLDLGWLHIPGISGRVDYSAVEHGSLWSSRVFDDICSGSLLLLRHDGNITVDWQQTLRLCCHCVCVYIPALPGLRLLTCAMVSASLIS